jgi:hypothetical protein
MVAVRSVVIARTNNMSVFIIIPLPEIDFRRFAPVGCKSQGVFDFY